MCPRDPGKGSISRPSDQKADALDHSATLSQRRATPSRGSRHVEVVETAQLTPVPSKKTEEIYMNYSQQA